MLKSFIRWSTILGVVVNSLVYSGFDSTLKALALSQEQILQKLSSVTVFTIGDEKGDILLFSEGNNNSGLLYISYQDAQKQLNALQKKNPNQSYKILPLTLAYMYQVVKANQGQPNAPKFVLIPTRSEVEIATKISRQQNQNTQQFNAVPVFYATFRQDNQEVYLIARAGNEPVIPLFLDQKTLQNELDKIIREQPETAKSITIRVMPLEALIVRFERENSEDVQKMILWPTQESVNFLQKIPRQNR